MDDIGQALQEVLADPQKMAELRTIAEGLGLNTLPQETGDTQEESPAPQLQISSPAPRQEALLQAIQAEEDKTQDKLKEKAGVLIRGGKNW